MMPEEEGLDAHVDHAGKDSGSAAGVNGAYDEMAGESGLDGDGGGFRIANLPYHNDLRVLAHEGAKRKGIGEVPREVDLGLADLREVELHRVFHSADAGSVLLHEVAKRGVNGGGFSGTSRAGKQEHSRWAAKQVFKNGRSAGLETQLIDVKSAAFGIKDANDNLFSARERMAEVCANHRKKRKPKLHAALARSRPSMSFLRTICFVVDQIRHDFQTRRDFLGQFQRQTLKLPENAVEAEADEEAFLPRLNVDVAGIRVNSVQNNAFDHLSDIHLFQARTLFHNLTRSIHNQTYCFSDPISHLLWNGSETVVKSFSAANALQPTAGCFVKGREQTFESGSFLERLGGEWKLPQSKQNPAKPSQKTKSPINAIPPRLPARLLPIRKAKVDVYLPKPFPKNPPLTIHSK